MISQFDLVRAYRSCRSRPLFVLTVALIIVIAGSASTVALGVGYAVLWTDLPYRDADNLVIVSGHPTLPLVRETTYRAISGQLSSLESACLWRTEAATLTGAGRPDRIGGVVSSASFFEVLGAVPMLGRTFEEEEEQLGRRNVIVVSEGFWMNRLDGTDSALGSTVRLDGELVTVIGVMPSTFRFPTSPNHLRFDSIPPVEYWRPLGDPNKDSKSLAVQLYNRNHTMMVKIASHAEFEYLSSELMSVLAGLKEKYPVGYARQDRLYSTKLTDELQGQYRPALLMFIAAVFAFCCMASLNVATLLLVQMIGRRREFAVGHALGGSQFHTLVQLFAEMVITMVVAAGGTLVLSLLGLKALKWAAPRELLQIRSVAIEPWSVGLSIVIIVLMASMLVLIPFLHLTRSRRSSDDLAVAGNRGASGAVSVSRALSVLLSMQIAIATVLVCGAGLLTRSFVTLVQEDPGFVADGLLTAQINVFPEDFKASQTRIDQMFIEMIDRLYAIPGVVDVGSVDLIPLAGARNISTTTPYGGMIESEITAEYRWTIGRYFDTMNIPLVRGRVLTQDDRSLGRSVAVVSDTFARIVWPNEDPIGKQFKRSTADRSSEWYSVVGVVGDVRNHGLDQAPLPQVYLAQPLPGTTFVIRSDRNPLSLVGEVRTAIWEVSPSVPISISTMDEVLGNSIAREKFSLFLGVFLAIVSFSLSLFGVFSVASYVATQQSHAIGIRLAVGATSRQVTWYYLRRSIVKVLTGFGLGIVALGFLNRMADELLYGVSVWDVSTLVLVFVAILFASIAATAWTLHSLMRRNIVRLLQ